MSAPSASGSVVLDPVDEQIVHALQIAPRVGFARLGEVLEIGETTAARRYRRLRRSGLVRVTLAVDPAALGLTVWHARIRCRPEGAEVVAEALSRRDDVSWVAVDASGWEVTCSVRSTAGDEAQRLITRQLPKSQSVLDVEVAALLHTFVGGSATDWAAWSTPLSAAQQEALAPDTPPVASAGDVATTVRPEDRAVLDALARDGRTPYAALARLTDSTPGRVRRRVEALLAAGITYFDVDVATAASGIRTVVALWLSVTPGSLARVGTALADHPHVPFAAAVTGRHNLTASLATRGFGDVYDTITTTLADLDGIVGYEVVPVGRRIKFADARVVGDRLAPPEPVRAQRARR
ncbi:Lrp/AsnC family transcriptional regulator [Williamsia serinedens]|uniref:DNA-binding transcriptional regulator, Lrp family n=1 Tax=Williamsia serinedens TaxID=391736 RepID=A0ABT1H0I1_9NOCA|nr:Lrp/AsnC family transcriptional regulator [Williamsia serinedens]MCP2159292.1 DNA-binding transcriptional regulator, Lrp family [Williamsia serinedens]